MRRRDFIKAIAGSAASWPLSAGAQQPNQVRHIGVLMAHNESDPEFKSYLDAFRQGLQKLGWIEGRNIQIDTRWGALDDAEMRQRSAKELIALGAISFSSSNHFALMPVSVNLFRLMCPTWRVQGDQIDSQMRSDVPTRNFLFNPAWLPANLRYRVEVLASER